MTHRRGTADCGADEDGDNAVHNGSEEGGTRGVGLPVAGLPLEVRALVASRSWMYW